MKHIIYLFALMLAVLSCNNQTAEKTTAENTIDTTEAVVYTPQTVAKIYIEDKSQYDQTFIDGLSEWNEPIKLIDNYIVTGKDTTYFPEDLPINKKVTFRGENEDYIVVLTVTRLNLTNLKYQFQISDTDNNIIDSRLGTAVLGSLFFFASEMDEDSETGDSYGSSEYLDRKNGCWFNIRIGFGLDDNGKQRAKINYNCKNKYGLDLDECPTLRTE